MKLSDARQSLRRMGSNGVAILLIAPLVAASAASTAAAQSWAPGTSAASIGTIDGGEEEVFADLAAVEVDANGNVYLGEHFGSVVHVFDRDGVHLGTGGGAGGGPGEIDGIAGMTVGPDGLLHVADAGNGRISTYELTPDGLVFREGIRLGFHPQGICLLDGRRYVLAAPLDPDGSLIREVDSEGQIVRTFGAPELPSRQERRVMGEWNHMINWGFIECDSASGTVLLLHQYLPLVRGFDPDGKELWQTILDSYHRTEFLVGRNSPGCCMYRVDADLGSAHVGYSLTTDGMGRVFVGLEESGPRLFQDARHEMRVLDAATGREIATERDVDGLVAGMASGRIYTYLRREPFPQVRVFEALDRSQR